MYLNQNIYEMDAEKQALHRALQAMNLLVTIVKCLLSAQLICLCYRLLNKNSKQMFSSCKMPFFTVHITHQDRHILFTYGSD